MSAFKLHAMDLLERGYSPVPIVPSEKRPLGQCAFYEHWNELRGTALLPRQIDILARSNPNLGLGVAGGFNCLVPVDIDTNDPAIKRAILEAIPKPKVAKVGAKGFTSFYWDERGMIEAMKFKCGSDFFAEILVTGQSVLPPTTHPETLLPYKWLTSATLFNTPVDQLPVISETHIQELKRALQPWLPKPEQHAVRRGYSAEAIADTSMAAYARTALRNEVQRLGSLSCGRNWGLFASACKLGRFIHHGALTEAEVVNALMGATRLNGYASAKHGGEKQAWKTLRSGLRKTQGDTLPELGGNHVYRTTCEPGYGSPRHQA